MRALRRICPRRPKTSPSARAATIVNRSAPSCCLTCDPSRAVRLGGYGVGSLSIGLALAAAALWGSGDFLGGFANRSTSLLSVLLISQGVGLAGMLIAAVVVGEIG